MASKRARSSERGLTAALVVETAAAVADSDGVDAVTLTRVSQELGCHVTSLRHYVPTVEALHREIALVAIRSLSDQLWQAALGISGEPALRALAAVYREFVREHGGLAEAMFSHRLTAKDPEFEAAGQRSVQPIQAALKSFGLTDANVVRAHRAFTAALRGFTTSETLGIYRGADADECFEAIVDLFVEGLTTGRWLRRRRR